MVYRGDVDWTAEPEREIHKIIKLSNVPGEAADDWTKFIKGVALSEGFAYNEVTQIACIKERVKTGLAGIMGEGPTEPMWTWTVHIYLNWWTL